MKNKGKLPEADTEKPDMKKGIVQKEEVRRNPDEHIDQDFEGFPDSPGREKTINPETEEDKVNANLKKKDTTGSTPKMSLGSADAFEETENKEVLRGELENENDDDEDNDEKKKRDKTHY
jgi:hypothetical protein